MRSLRSIHRKAAKKAARRKDYRWRANINGNVPTKATVVRKAKFGPLCRANGTPIWSMGRPQLEHIGYKFVVEKQKVYNSPDPSNRLHPLTDDAYRNIGMIAYPKNRKYQNLTTKK